MKLKKGGIIMSDFKAYITYDEYNELGGTVDNSTFTLLEKKAQRLLDTWTQDRLVNATIIPDVVKEALTYMIDEINSWGDGERVSSFSNGKVSFNFDISKTKEQELFNSVSFILPLNLISRAVE